MAPRFYPTQSLNDDVLYQNGTLEISAKPFFQKDDAYLTDLFHELFLSWRSLLKHCRQVSLLWWLGEGTELMEYDRDMDRKINWAMWQGFAHTDRSHGGDNYAKAVPYADAPVDITYGDIRRIVALMKAACRDILGKDLRVGTPFDPGSEFCLSPFRYQRHPEILMTNFRTGALANIDAIATFHADTTPYAAYPGGIPEGTVFGEFFGRQAQAYMADMGFDYLWLSNGFGFGRSPYASGGTGQFFDGEAYRPEGNREIHDQVISFWTLFRRHCPDVPVECRGTDFPAGVNLVNHAVPYTALYEGGYNIVPPPNTPWPALTHNHGLAIAGFLSQNASFPGDAFPLRYYATDPWFNNNPWFDRWDRSPHDIYLNTALCKIAPDGRLLAVDRWAILSVDGVSGEIPEEVPDEIIPHFKRAAAFRPDGLPPVLWVYPMDAYDQYVFGPENRMDEPFGGDLSILGALNHAFPLSGVVSARHLAALRRAQAASVNATLLVTPPPEPGSDWERNLLAHLDAGGRVLCYGSLAHAGAEWLRRLGLAADAAPLEGEFAVQLPGRDAPATPYFHDSLLAQGPLVETAAPGGAARILATAAQGGATRVLAASRGAAVWVRGATNVTRQGLVWRRMDTRPESEWFAPETLFNLALESFGWSIETVHGPLATEAVHFLVARCRNGFVFTGHSADDDARLRVRAPWGAPLPVGHAVAVSDGAAEFEVHTWFHDEVKAFVRQTSGTVECRSVPVGRKSFRRRLHITGLDHATLRFYVEAGCERNTQALLCAPGADISRCAFAPVTLQTDENGTWFELRGISGSVDVGWGANAML